MNILSQQSKSLVLAIAIALGATALVAGCSHHDNTNGANTPATHKGGVHGGIASGNGNPVQPVSDAWITTKVKTAFATMKGVDSSNIHVETNHGAVTLTGTASSQASIKEMANTAKNVKGVTSVDTSGLHVGSKAHQ